jgi:hypothetical protein
MTGLYIFAVLFLVVGLAISNNNKHELHGAIKPSMEDGRTIRELSLRFMFKYLEDRGTLWESAWKQITDEKNLMPPYNVNKIKYYADKGRIKEFEHHSHNIYIELLRSSGIIMGSIIALALIRIIIYARNFFFQQNARPNLVLLASVSISSLILGSITGLYPLLVSFAIISLGILGIVYGVSFAEDAVSSEEVEINERK